MKIYLDDVAKNFIENLEIDKPLYEMSPEEARSFLLDIQKLSYISVDAKVEDINIFDDLTGEIAIKLVKPQYNINEKLPLIVYCHGGGWVIGDFKAYESMIKTLANCTNSAIAFVEYPRSPEFPYPHAINHIYTALNYLHDNGSDYNLDTEKIAIAGDSVGGNMAAVTALRAKKDNGVKICFQLLLYPVVDAEMKTESYKEFKNGPWLSKKAMEWFWDCYEPDKNLRKEAYLSPLKSELDDLKNLPSTLVITAENDVLRDEGEDYARKLIEAGVEAACVRVNNTFHDFIMLNGLRESKAVQAAYKLICESLKCKLHE